MPKGRYGLRYKRGTWLAVQYPNGPFQFETREAAEKMRRVCGHADQMEVFEVDHNA